MTKFGSRARARLSNARAPASSSILHFYNRVLALARARSLAKRDKITAQRTAGSEIIGPGSLGGHVAERTARGVIKQRVTCVGWRATTTAAAARQACASFFPRARSHALASDFCVRRARARAISMRARYFPEPLRLSDSTYLDPVRPRADPGHDGARV